MVNFLKQEWKQMLFLSTILKHILLVEAITTLIITDTLDSVMVGCHFDGKLNYKYFCFLP